MHKLSIKIIFPVCRIFFLVCIICINVYKPPKYFWFILHVSYSRTGARIEISNPFKHDLINVLKIRIKADIIQTNIETELFSFDLNGNRNRLILLTTAAGANTATAKKLPQISMGKFTGREEVSYKLKDEQNSLFVFVIEGVFEVLGRLLHARDGLGFWDISEDIELEAVSNDAIVLLIEC